MTVAAQAYFTTSTVEFLQDFEADNGRAWFADHMRHCRRHLCDSPGVLV